MGFRYRKSINLGGGFRVNISKSGVGYSWGVKGYRITRTADGRTRQTASIPGTGISYVSEHKSGYSGNGKAAKPSASDVRDDYYDYQEITSSDANLLRSPIYDKLFEQIKRLKLARNVLILAVLATSSFLPLFYLCLVALAVLLIKGRCHIIYEFEDDEKEKWDRLSSAWRGVASSQSLQEVVVTAKSKNAKETGGIEKAVETSKISSSNRLPWYVTTNIKPVVFKLKNQQIAIMPDRILIFGKKQFGALDYKDVNIDISAFGFLEGKAVPSDSEIVKTVWAYANKDGSPDKRYANNKQYPIAKYGKVVLTSDSGLNVHILCSNESASDKLFHVLYPGKPDPNQAKA